MIDKIKFVALGDSLTFGFQSPNIFLPGGEEFPYTQFLETILVSELPKKGLSRVEAYFRNVGMLGDTTRSMLQRFDAHVAALEPDYVIVWGGINDLFMLQSVDSILDNLKQIYWKAREADVEPIACTVTSVTGNDHIVPRIVELNDMIRSLCEEQGILIADLFAATSDENARLMETFSSDGVHLSSAGYRKIAYTIYYEVIEPILDNLEKAGN